MDVFRLSEVFRSLRGAVGDGGLLRRRWWVNKQADVLFGGFLGMDPVCFKSLSIFWIGLLAGVFTRVGVLTWSHLACWEGLGFWRFLGMKVAAKHEEFLADYQWESRSFSRNESNAVFFGCCILFRCCVAGVFDIRPIRFFILGQMGGKERKKTLDGSKHSASKTISKLPSGLSARIF